MTNVSDDSEIAAPARACKEMGRIINHDLYQHIYNLAGGIKFGPSV